MPVVIAMTNTVCTVGIFRIVAKVRVFFLWAKQKKAKKKTLLLRKICRQYNTVSTDTKLNLQKKLRFSQKFAPAKIPTAKPISLLLFLLVLLFTNFN